MNKKIFILIVIIFVIGFIFIRKNKTNNSEPQNTIFENETATSEVNVEEITFSNITKTYNEGITTISANVKNNTNKEKNLNVEIEVLDKEGKQITKMFQIIENLKPGRMQKLSTGVVGEYASEMYEVKIRLVSDNEIRM